MVTQTYDGNVRSILCYLICLKHLSRSNRNCFLWKDLFIFHTCATWSELPFIISPMFWTFIFYLVKFLWFPGFMLNALLLSQLYLAAAIGLRIRIVYWSGSCSQIWSDPVPVFSRRSDLDPLKDSRICNPGVTTLSLPKLGFYIRENAMGKCEWCHRSRRQGHSRIRRDPPSSSGPTQSGEPSGTPSSPKHLEPALDSQESIWKHLWKVVHPSIHVRVKELYSTLIIHFILHEW